MQLTSTSAVIKEIEYDRETKDYAAFVTIDERREYIGSRRSYGEADRLCDEYAYHHFADNHTPEVATQIAVAMADDELPFCFFCGPGADHNTRGCPRLEEENSDAPSPGVAGLGICPICDDEMPNGWMRMPEGDILDTNGMRVNWSESPTDRLIPCAELHELRQRNPDAFRARLASLDEAALEMQACVYAIYASAQTGQDVTKDETLARFRRSVAIHRARGELLGSEDAISHVIYELALTDIPALVEFLRGHTDAQRDQLAWRFTAWLRRHHGIVREPAHIARGWASLIVGAAEIKTGRAQAQAGADERGQGDQHGPSTNGTIDADYTTKARR